MDKINIIKSNQLQYKSRVVDIGGIPMGGDFPVRIQSMTNTNTQDTISTVEQIIRIVDAGAEYVRISTPGMKDAENLINIKNELKKRGYTTPLIADIHFNPKVAETAAKLVEKIRINPGNYTDKKKFEHLEYSDAEYSAEITTIKERIYPLLEICKQHNTAIRIGTNHGSLSDRIMSRYGDTPLGMVEATMEFLRIFVEADFHNIVVALKSSNTRIMIYATRLLIHRMIEENMTYPVHLGVTEAGSGEEGRIKSAVGIGTLLAEGIGDTIRVSLTEAPENEISVAKYIANYYKKNNPYFQNPFEYSKRLTFDVCKIGGDNTSIVIADLSNENYATVDILSQIGYVFDKSTNKWQAGDLQADFIYLKNKFNFSKLPDNMKFIFDANIWNNLNVDNFNNCFPFFNVKQYLCAEKKSSKLNFVKINSEEITSWSSKNNNLLLDKTIIFVIETNNTNSDLVQRQVLKKLQELNCKTPVVFRHNFDIETIEEFQVESCCRFGPLFIDGIGDGIWISNAKNKSDIKSDIKSEVKYNTLNSTAFAILQASRVRISKTEYISCPSCARTMFDIQSLTVEICKHTSHLKGLKIGIMGCVVNGLGELADADYGVLGTGNNKVAIYKGKNILKKGVATENATKELINSIKEFGNWKDKITE